MKKILFVCQHYYPETFQITEICEELVNKGYDVTALVGLPNYPLGYIFDEYKYGKKRIETINGVKVIRCSEIGRRKGVLFLALNYISFWFSSIMHIRKLDDKFDLVIGYETSPITMVDAASRYSKKFSKKFYLFCVDIWPECLKVYLKSEKNIIYFIFNKISKRIYSSADKIFCTSKSFIEYLINKHSIDNKKIYYLPQFGDDSLLNIKYDHKNKETIDLVFTGNVGREQNLSNVIEALHIIKDKQFKFHIVGDGSDLSNVIKKVKLLSMEDKVIFYGRRPKKEMEKFYKIADACILPLKCDNEIGKTLPNKLQNYMAAGRPILGMISGSAKEIIEEAKCGLCVEGNDVEGFSQIVKYFIEHNKCIENYSINAREYYMKNFRKNIIIDKLVDLLEM